MPMLTPPDTAYPLTGEKFDYRPSWARPSLFINEEHEKVFDQTKDLPGWQLPADSRKLYEMAFHCGAVILEIGMFGGRSAVVELKGALAGAAARPGEPLPQYYGVDVSMQAVHRTFGTIKGAGLEDRALLYHGELRRFLRDLPITPTMVFVDGDHSYEGCWSDLNILRDILPPGAPVLCHDYKLEPAVARAVDESIARGWYACMGRFAGAVLLAALPGRGVRPPRRLSPEVFERTRVALLERFRSRGISPPPKDWFTLVADLTREARAELATPSEMRRSSGRSGWPYVNPEPPLPGAMADGRPWPRITVVTPSYNQGKYIEETILSVRNQGYPNVEHIVVDGGSKDETVEVVGRYLDGIAYFVSEKDKGQSDAINKGFARATGEIYTWINSDDMLAPGALAAAAMAFKASGADLVNGICRVYKDGALSHQCLSSVDSAAPMPLEDLLDIENCWMKGEFWFQPDVMFTRALWEKAGGKVEVGWYYSMDYELWVRFAQAGAKVHVIGRPLCWFRAHEEQKTAEKAAAPGENGAPENGKAAPAKPAEQKGFVVELPRVRDAFCASTGRTWTPREQPPVKNRLRVAFFNDLGFQFGAGIAHRRLAETLASAGHTVRAFAAASATPFLEKPRHSSRQIVERLAAFKPDLVVVGNLHGADLEPVVLERIAARFETIFVLHDLWLFTGRCTYTGGCGKYLAGCGPACTCPSAYPVMPPEAVAPAWEAKRRMLASSPRLTVMGNSRWMREKAREAVATLPKGQRPATDWVKFGFDLETLRPRDKQDCREALGLPADKFLIMSSAASLSDERKGIGHLAEAMKMMAIPEAQVVSVGWFKPGQEPPIPGMRTLGYMNDPVRLAMLYSAADLFVGPSREEAFGQVYIEAAACGTPAVGYPVGGVPEAIADGVTGRLAARVSPDALADVILELYRDGAARRDMARHGRIHVENEWSRAAAMHHLHTALQRTGVAARVGLSRKIDLTRGTEVPEPAIIAPVAPGYRPLWGLENYEGPNPARNLGRYRWTVGPTCGFEVKAERPGAARLVLGCRSVEEGQRVRLVHKSAVVGERDVPATPEADQMLAFDVDLDAGPNTFELHHWKWKLGSGRSAALLVTSLNVVPVG